MKERLTGAIILVVLVVALVPELLSGPKSPPMGQLATTADGAAIRSVSVDLSEPAAPVGAGAPATVAVPSPASAAAGSATAAPDGSSERLAAAPAGAPAKPAPANPAPDAAAPPTEAAEVPTPDPIVRRPRQPAPAADAVPARAAVGKESFSVQAGLFSNRGNANRLVQQLGSKGLVARISVVKSGTSELYRVRIGAPGDRAAATALIARVKAAGFSALLIPSPSQVVATP